MWLQEKLLLLQPRGWLQSTPGSEKGVALPGQVLSDSRKLAQLLASRDPFNTWIPREPPWEGRGTLCPSRWLSASRVTASGSPACVFPCSGKKRQGGSGAVRRGPPPSSGHQLGRRPARRSASTPPGGSAGKAPAAPPTPGAFLQSPATLLRERSRLAPLSSRLERAGAPGSFANARGKNR